MGRKADESAGKQADESVVKELVKDGTKFAAVLKLSDYLMLDSLLMRILIPTLVLKRAEEAIMNACVEAVPNLPTLIGTYHAKIIASALDEGSDKEADTFYDEYVEGTYAPNDGHDHFTFGGMGDRVCQLLFSTVFRKDAATLRAVVEDAKVKSLPDHQFNSRRVRYADVMDGMIDDEQHLELSLLQYAAQVDAAECAEAILAVEGAGREGVGTCRIWGMTPRIAWCQLLTLPPS